MKKLRKLLALCLLLTIATTVSAQAEEAFSSNIVADEGAWCWFADPRALHYENATGTINATYIGYIDVHGNVKATQYDWLQHRKTDVLVRSYFQPDDHNNPTFLVLPDERVMIFYTRHTDEPRIWYRISKRPGDITSLGEEKFLATQNNTTYPSPFILSDDPTHIYLCWRGINWHPTIARLTMPDANDNCQFDFGPRQIVQSTGARPYAKYQSNGKDNIYLSYTTGHPDNEMPDWLYFNVIDINHGDGPILRDIKGTQLKRVSDGVFNVSKTDSYASSYPLTIVDRTANIRNWVWQITIDKSDNPVIAYPHIDDAKTTHVYWYARWTGSEWRRTWVQYGGHAFHQNWNSTEKCYSGGMAIDPENINDLYLSIPTKDGKYNKDGVYEIWKYVIDDEGKVASSEQITHDSPKNNARPFIIPGSKNSPLRLAWMQGDYYYWIVKQGYPQGYPTAIHCNYQWQEELTPEDSDEESPRTDCICLAPGKTVSMGIAMDASNYSGKLFEMKNMTYALDADYYPVVTIGGKSFRSQNRLLTSDDWATQSTGTSGDNHPTKLTTWVITMTYDGHVLTCYRNGLVDQVIETDNLEVDVPSDNNNAGHKIVSLLDYYAVASPLTVQQLSAQTRQVVDAKLKEVALSTIKLPSEARTDIVLPTVVMGQTVSWQSSDAATLSPSGIVNLPASDTEVTLTATCGTSQRQFNVTVHPREIEKNLRYEHGLANLSGNTQTGFSTNSYVVAPEGLLTDLRSFTFLLTVNAASLAKAPRCYDFGSGSGNSVFLRANPLSAGIKYNGGTTTMVNSPTQLATNKEYKLAVTFDAATKTTRIYIDGEEAVAGTANQTEPYELALLAADARNYIGRTQWWDTSYAADNVDFKGTIDAFRLYDIALTKREICQLQGIDYQDKELPTVLVNPDFEAPYSVMQGSGVSADRAIYVPQGWTVDYSTPNNNDLTALKAGDLYYNNFFASRPKPSNDSQQTYWIRQNWGTSTITLKQEVRLPAGEYTLTADVWKSGLGGDAVVAVQTEGHAAVNAPSLQNKVEWQQTSIDLQSDGQASTTILLSAVHTSNGSEKIIGFDNLKLSRKVSDGINTHPATGGQQPANDSYDLQGRPVNPQSARGIYIRQGKKHLAH